MMSAYRANKKITEMSEREYERFKSRREAYYIRRRVTFSFIGLVLAVIVLSLFFKVMSSSAAEYDKNSKCKYYKTEMMRFDQSLDDIAADNFDAQYFSSVEALKKEIMEINHIDYESAIPGGLILYIPYYGDVH